MKKSKVTKVTKDQSIGPHAIIKLLLADHKLLRTLMNKIKSQKASPREQKKNFSDLKKTVISHVKAEEKSFLSLIKDHPRFKDHVLEGYEEHRVHEYIFDGIVKVKEMERKTEQMKIFCEILEHHLDEEEEELFPRFKKYFAKSTNKKVGKNFLKERKKTNTLSDRRGAARYSN